MIDIFDQLPFWALTIGIFREAEIDRFHVSRVDETFMNPWNLGPPVNWTNSFQGWTQEKRYQLYKLFKTWTQQVIQVQPYTKTGFRRAKIPDDLYKVIIK